MPHPPAARGIARINAARVHASRVNAGEVPDSLLRSPSLLRLDVEGNPALTPPATSGGGDGGGTLSAGAIAGICVGGARS